MSAIVAFEITDYLPQGFNFKGYTFNFKTDKVDETIEKKNVIKINIANLKKDRKFVIRVYRTGSLVGISELVLGQLLFIKRTEEYSKMINIIMTDAVKKELFGPQKNNNKSLQLNVKTRIYYDDDPFAAEVHKAVQKPMAVFAAGADTGPQRITVVSQAAKGFSKRALMEQNEAARMSVYAIKTPEEEFLAAENTFIDPIFDDEHDEDFTNEDKYLNEFMDNLNEKFASDVIQNETNEDVLREKCRDAVLSIFEAQKIYYTAFYKTQSLNRFLRELLVKYNQKYRVIYKKYNRLREQFESNSIRKNLTALNSDENKRILNAIQQSSNELEVYKCLFRLAYDEEEVKRFTEDLPERAQRKRDLLTKVVKGIYQKNSEYVHEEQKISLDYVVGKYKLQNSTGDHPNENDFVFGGENGTENGNDTDQQEVGTDNEGAYENDGENQEEHEEVVA